MTFNYTLLADGPTDVSLLPILNWLLINNGLLDQIEGKWADHRRFSPIALESLENKIMATLSLYSCDLLFIHRDAERGPRYRNTEKSYKYRLQEINTAVEIVKRSTVMVPNICVIPIRMTEAWLLFDVYAIRRAAGNRNGTMSLTLPILRDLETLPNPKESLKYLLKIASGLRGRRLYDFPFEECVRQIPKYIDDFSPLRLLSAFRHLEDDIRKIIVELN